MSQDAVALTQALVRVDSASAHEARVIECLEPWLPAHRTTHRWRAGRDQLVAAWPGHRPLTFSGHLDTVPVEASAWTADPWGGQLLGDRLFGRGSSDMKSGLAAFLVAVRDHVATRHDCAGVQLILTAAEETGCEGAQQLDLTGLVRGGPLLVGEMTGNHAILGHKGATWLTLSTVGRAAHGSRPELGENAALAMARLVVALESRPLPSDPALGAATCSLGTLHSGVQTNIVPDAATATVDIRTVPGFDSRAAVEHVRRTAEAAGVRVAIEPTIELAPVITPRDHPFAELTAALVPLAAQPATYFTDASILASRLNASATVLLGPGQVDQAHAVDEYCLVSAIRTAHGLYRKILDTWCAAPSEGGSW
jgi:succinyl-diaminopimelate desuccinylase